LRKLSTGGKIANRKLRKLSTGGKIANRKLRKLSTGGKSPIENCASFPPGGNRQSKIAQAFHWGEIANLKLFSCPLMQKCIQINTLSHSI
jgi:hypothetical protein